MLQLCLSYLMSKIYILLNYIGYHQHCFTFLRSTLKKKCVIIMLLQRKCFVQITQHGRRLSEDRIRHSLASLLQKRVKTILQDAVKPVLVSPISSSPKAYHRAFISLWLTVHYNQHKLLYYVKMIFVVVLLNTCGYDISYEPV